MHRVVIVEDHALAAVLRLATGAQQVLGDVTARGRAFELADGRLHQRVDELQRLFA